MSISKFAGRAMALAVAAMSLMGVADVLPARAAQLVDFTNVAFAPVTGDTSIPVGHADFCRRNPSECTVNANLVEDVHLTPANWQQLLDVNTYFNTTIVPETDEQLYHVAEYWTYPTDGRGDCEDIALEKRRELIAAGWDPSALLMTVVREPNGDGHAVLMARTDRGDLILDNQDNRVLVWNKTPYEFIKRQSQADAGKWVALNDNRTTVVATANN